MKTKVKVKEDENMTQLKAGDVGYIDGYVQAADGRPYAVVVIFAKGIIDFCSLHNLTPIH